MLLVVPFVERFGLVEPFVTLQTNKPRTDHLSHALGELGLTRTRRTLDKDRLFKPIRQIDDAGQAIIGQVVNILQTFAY